MDLKTKCWTITYVTARGYRNTVECDNKEVVDETINNLIKQKIKADTINIFPPRSNLTYREFIHY